MIFRNESDPVRVFEYEHAPRVALRLGLLANQVFYRYLPVMSKVLIIDDDEIVLALLRNVLQDEGYDVLTTADGPYGISMYTEVHPDLVLLDLGLPSMNGLEVLRRIKSLDIQARVIVVTGLGSKDSAELALRSGAVDFVSKPLDYQDFMRRIKAAIPS